MNKTLIQNVLTLTPAGVQSVDVQVIDALIEAVAPANTIPADSQQQIVSGEDKLLLPGFVNGHTHSSQVWQRGLIPQLPLELWLADVFDSTPSELDRFYWGAVSTAVDTILSGGTCVMDHAYVIPGQEKETMAALIRGYKAAGIRAVIAPLIQDMPFSAGFPQGNLLRSPNKAPSYASKTADEILSLMESLIQTFHDPDEGIYIGLGPTGFHRCSDDLLQGCMKLSDHYRLCYHTHLLETKAQQQLAQERYDTSGVKHLHQLGCLQPHTSLAHGVWLNDDDIELLAATGATLVHNPVSNLRLGSGLAPILKCLQAGVNVSFGCDGAASNDAQNLLEVIKLGTILHNISDSDYRHWLTPVRALEMATIGGAKGVGLGDRTGTLAPGMEADIVLYDLNHPSLLPCADPLQLLVLGRPTDVVEAVWIKGKLVVESGQLLTVDTHELHSTLRRQALPINSFEFQQIQRVESHYRQVMIDQA